MFFDMQVIRIVSLLFFSQIYMYTAMHSTCD